MDPNHFESEILLSEEIERLYIDEFRRCSIPHRLDTYGGENYISWSQVYGPKVDCIRQKVNLDFRRLSRARAVDDGRLPEKFIDDEGYPGCQLSCQGLAIP